MSVLARERPRGKRPWVPGSSASCRAIGNGNLRALRPPLDLLYAAPEHVVQPLAHAGVHVARAHDGQPVGWPPALAPEQAKARARPPLDDRSIGLAKGPCRVLDLDVYPAGSPSAPGAARPRPRGPARSHRPPCA